MSNWITKLKFLDVQTDSQMDIQTAIQNVNPYIRWNLEPCDSGSHSGRSNLLAPLVKAGELTSQTPTLTIQALLYTPFA